MINQNVQGGNLASVISQKILSNIVKPLDQVQSGLGYFPTKIAGRHLNVFLLTKNGNMQEARIGRGAKGESKLIGSANFTSSQYELETVDASILITKEVLDIQESKMFNYDFQSNAVKDAQMSIELALNRCFFSGHKKVKGILNHPKIKKISAAKTWATATGTEIIKELNNLVSETENGTLIKPDTIALPPKYFNMLIESRTDYQNESILRVFRKNREGGVPIKFIKSLELDKKYHKGASDYIVCFESSSRIAEFLLAKDFYLKGGILDERGDYRATAFKDFYGLFVYHSEGIKILQGIG